MSIESLMLMNSRPNRTTPSRTTNAPSMRTILTMPSSGADRKSTRLNSSHLGISYAVFCLKKEAVGRVLGEQGRGRVDGGGSVGLMGVGGDASLDGGGGVLGVIPRKLTEREKEQRGLRKVI